MNVPFDKRIADYLLCGEAMTYYRQGHCSIWTKDNDTKRIIWHHAGRWAGRWRVKQRFARPHRWRWFLVPESLLAIPGVSE